MKTINNISEQTLNSEEIGAIELFFKKVRMGTLLSQANISKTKGASPLIIFSIIFNLTFTGKNFFQGIVRNQYVTIGKDAVYNFLNNASYNWRRLNLKLVSSLYFLIRSLLDNSSEEVLIFDDSSYYRNRSKKVELLARVFDHTFKRFFKGFRMLTLGWSDGNSFLGIDFALLSSADAKNRYQEIIKQLDKRCCGYKRRLEAIAKAPELMAAMVKRALSIGVKAKVLLMDSWFSAPAIIAELRQIIEIICMLKDQPTWLYVFKGKKLRLSDLYKKLTKRRGKAKVKASVVVTASNGEKVKIIFVSCDKKRGWLALLSTNIELPDEEIIRLYGKRWDIEVFFKMAKQHLKLATEIQLRDFDGLIAHTTIVMMRYNFLSYYQRLQVDHRSFGDLFRWCCEEMNNISFLEAFKRIMILAINSIRKCEELSEKAIQAMIDAVMGVAIQFFKLDARYSPIATPI